MSAATPIVAAFVALTNSLAIVSFDERGAIDSIVERASGRELVEKKTAFAYARFDRGRRSVPPRLMRSLGGGRYEWEFHEGIGSLVLSVEPFEGGFTFRSESCTVKGVDSVDYLRVMPVCRKWIGYSANMYSDERSAVCLRAYAPPLAMTCRSHEGLKVEAFAAGGLAGHSAGLVVAPRSSISAALKSMTFASGVAPSPNGGAWALESRLTRSSYMFADYLATTNLAQWIDFAKMCGCSTLHHQAWYTKLGHYIPREDKFPGGMETIRRVAGELHDAGLFFGMHMLTGGIGFSDSWVTPRAHPDLWEDASYTLARDYDGGGELFVNERPADFHDTVFHYSSRGNFLRIGSELLQYSGIRREKPYAFTGVTRGACRTEKGGAYPAGTHAGYLHCRYAMFFPRPGSALEDALADSIAAAYNAGGFDQIYFDGADLGYGTMDIVDSMCRKIYDRLRRDRKPVAEGGGGPHAWWWRSRAGTWDPPKWAPKRFHDTHVAAVARVRDADLLQPQTGWWQTKTADENSRGFFLDEMEYYAAKNAAIDASSSLHGLNPAKPGGLPEYVRRCLAKFGDWERLRLDREFSPEALARLAEPGAEFRLRRIDGVWRLIPVDVLVHRAGHKNERKWCVKSDGTRRVALRVEALYGIGGGEGVAMHGGGFSEERHEAPYLDLGKNGAFKCRVKGDGSGAVLRFAVESPREYRRAVSEHYLKVDFNGWRDIAFLARERDTGGTDFYSPPEFGHSPEFMAELKLRHVSEVSWKVVRPGASADSEKAIEISPAVALPVLRSPARRFALSIGSRRIEVPFALASGEFAEMEDGVWTHWSEAGEVVAEAPAGECGAISLVAGENTVSIECDPSVRAEITVISLGDPIPLR